MKNLVFCGGFSPGARVLRAAIRKVCSERTDLRIITTTPAIAGISNALEEIRELKSEDTIVIDGCEGACGLQTLLYLGLKPKSSLLIKKYAMVNEENIRDAQEEILIFLEKEG